jgi:hypothetical protein
MGPEKTDVALVFFTGGPPDLETPSLTPSFVG